MLHVIPVLFLLTCIQHGMGRNLGGRALQYFTFDSKVATSEYFNKSKNASDFNCVLISSNKSRDYFRHFVYYQELNFVYLNIQTGEGVSMRGSKYVVGERKWTWTFYGEDGALEFLNWPAEFGIWSMGLLNTYVGELPVTILRDSGNCTNLTVGEHDVNNAISKALIQLVFDLINISMAESEKYGPSFFCYKERMFIQPESLYVFCKHIICPFQAIQYRCCSYMYIQDIGRRDIVCNNRNMFHYDNLWWIGPIVVSILFFAYCPLLLMKLALRLSIDHQRLEKPAIPYSDDGNLETFVFYSGKSHVTLINTLLSPFLKAYSGIQSKCSRVMRICLPFLSISVIGIQICLDNNYLKPLVLESVSKGTPMGFRSMLAGYDRSVRNFLPYLGGPYVALSLYVIIAIIFVAIPTSLSRHLESGIPENNSPGVYSPLIFSLKRKELFSSVTIHGQAGFRKVSKVCFAQFYMLLNKAYWEFAIEIQIRRWRAIKHSKARLIIFPFYILICIIEHLLCLALYGLPVVYFSQVLFRSYYMCIPRIQRFRRMNGFFALGTGFIMIILVASLTLFLFMGFTIFLDASLFLTRLFIFTFTGIVIYPKASYGYLIFALTAVYYLVDCVKDFSETYKRILKATIKVCKRLQRANDVEPLVIKQGIFFGVRTGVLNHVIERLLPIRRKVFSSVLKLCVVLGAIGCSLLLLEKTDKFRELHILVHVSTALFTCAVPKITRTVFGKSKDRISMQKLEERIERVVSEANKTPFNNGGSESDTDESIPAY